RGTETSHLAGLRWPGRTEGGEVDGHKDRDARRRKASPEGRLDRAVRDRHGRGGDRGRDADPFRRHHDDARASARRGGVHRARAGDTGPGSDQGGPPAEAVLADPDGRDSHIREDPRRIREDGRWRGPAQVRRLGAGTRGGRSRTAPAFGAPRTYPSMERKFRTIVG